LPDRLHYAALQRSEASAQGPIGREMSAAANAVREARERAGHARYERRRRSDPEVEAEAARQLAAEEERIARKYDMCPG
jgi:hypothetical protein